MCAGSGLERSCATDMRLRRSGSLKGAPAVESSSCYRNFSKCKYTEMENGLLIWQGQNTNREAEGEAGKKDSFFFFFLFLLAANRWPSPCPASLDGSFVA